jgi:hypothetical protein
MPPTDPPLLEIPPATPVEDVASLLGIPADFSRITLVNGQDPAPGQILEDGDVVSLFPPLAGGGGSESRACRPSHRAKMDLVRRTTWALILVVMLGGCTVHSVPGRDQFDLGFMVLDATPVDAQVAIDGRPTGRARDYVGQVLYLRTGVHTVEVFAKGYVTASHRIKVEPGFPAYVRVALRQDVPRVAGGN